MKLVNRDLWEAYGVADAILVTTNAFVNKHGELAMGRGAAWQLKKKFPDYPGYFGNYLRMRGLEGQKYGLILLPGPDQETKYATMLGVFQVKYHWQDMADPDLIQYSTDQLLAYLAQVEAETKGSQRIVMNYPGIGNGRLTEEQVEPIIRKLPDNVWVCKR